jgi:peroxiredoxin
MPFLIAVVLLSWAGTILACWLAYHLLRQNGRILQRLDALEQVLAEGAGLPGAFAPEPEVPRGLPVGTQAPVFELPDLSGSRVALSRWRGRKVLLIFFNPRCGYCLDLAPGLAALPWDRSGSGLVPLVVTTGTQEENRKLFREHGVRCPVLRQDGMEVASVYGADGTPMGCLVDEEGRIASDLAVGASALLSLAQAAPDPALAAQKLIGKATRPLSESQIERDGLPAGTPAPSFRLPRVTGGELSLEELRGRPVLLVFSDPECGPCDELAPRLEQIHREQTGLQVLMVSRGSAEENAPKAAEHGLTFPVLLQRKWEISRLYGMFGTPIGYLIDENGVIARDVAVGVNPIEALANGTPPLADGKTGAPRKEESVPMN